LNTTPGGGGKFHTTTPAPLVPQFGHQITGTTVVLSDPDSLVVIHVFVVISVLDSMDTPVGNAVMVDVIVIEPLDSAMSLEVVDEPSVGVSSKGAVASPDPGEIDDGNVADNASLMRVGSETTPESLEEAVKLGLSVRSSMEGTTEADLVEI
jgi:hypothetical protein